LHDELRPGEPPFDPVAALALEISLSETAGVYLFTGLIGSGKSTELRRLKALLKPRGTKAIIINMADYANLDTPIEITDLLISIGAGLAAEVEHRCGGSNISRSGFFTRIAQAFSAELRVKGIDISAEAGMPDAKAGAKLQTELHIDATFKRQVQESLRGSLGRLLGEVRGIAHQAIEALRARYGQEYNKFAILLDSLEQLRGRGHAEDAVLVSVRSLYRDYAQELSIPEFQTVYTVPPYLLRLEPQLVARYGQGNLCNLTCVHVFKDRSREPDAAGIAQLVQVVEKRYPNWRGAIEEAALRQLICLSGGDLRSFFTALRACLLHGLTTGAALPLQTKVVERTRDKLLQPMSLVPDAVMLRLKHAWQHFEPPMHGEKPLDDLGTDLETKRLMLYRNGTEWYGVNPLLWQMVEAFTPPEAVPNPTPATATNG
jgi:energy-coupling factor transporter ATP-binding protein EcfA2